jgi:hypothetical protein
MSHPLASPDELVVFAHGMGNFGHNRGTKVEQERLLESRVDVRHSFLGVFDDSGNYAFISCLGADSVREDVLVALNEKYDVSGVVVVDRASCSAALEEVERVARKRYGRFFEGSDYSVHKPSGLWRVGLVFTDCSLPIDDVIWRQAEGIAHDRLRVLTTGNGIVEAGGSRRGGHRRVRSWGPGVELWICPVN